MKKSGVLAALAAMALAGCVTPQVAQPPAVNVDFHRFQTATLKVHTTPTTEYGSDQVFASQSVTLLESVVRARLTAIGYAPPADGAAADVTVDLAVTAVKEGSGAARFWVGFGAGRAVLLFDATFIDPHGTTVAMFHGGKSYTGMEIGSSFADKDQIEAMAATRAANQIEEFVRNNGTFPSQAPQKAAH